MTRHWFECWCSCHSSPECIMHCAPCCDGKCFYCGKYIHGMKEHIADAHPDVRGVHKVVTK